MNKKLINLTMVLTIFSFYLLLSCASTNYTPVENKEYQSPCFDFTLPEGKWLEISQSKLIDSKYDCLEEPTIFEDSTNDIAYSIVLEYVSRGFRTIDKNKIFKELKNVFDNKSNKYGKYKYRAEEIRIKGRDCFKAYFESLAPGDTNWQFEGRSFNLKLDRSKDVIHQGVAVYCLYPTSSIWKGDPYVLSMFFDRFSTDLNPDQNFENETMKFFKSIELPYLRREVYEKNQEN